jgi:hypothetical protein
MRDEADGYQGMHALVAELVLPTGRRASCFGRLRVMAGLVGARRLPAAT